MYKVTPTYSNGYDFVQISSLPFEQQMAFDEWVPKSSVQRFTINNITLTDCVAYQEYNYWFDFLYQKVNRVFEDSF